MKKLLFIFAAVISLVAYSINTYADGVIKIYKNGNYFVLNANDVDSLVFASSNKDDGHFEGDYFQISLDGKTYSAENFIYIQMGPWRNSDDQPITFTYEGKDDFDEEGFFFNIGVIHYSRKADLLACSPGTYGHVKGPIFQYEDENLKNLTFFSSLMVDFNDYDLMGGTHNVTSIKEVNGSVQLEGNFTSNFEYKNDKRTVTGSYKITIP